MLSIPDPDSSSEESEDSVSIVNPSDKNLIYEEDIFEESQEEIIRNEALFLEESSESIEYAEDELESLSRDQLSVISQEGGESESQADS